VISQSGVETAGIKGLLHEEAFNDALSAAALYFFIRCRRKAMRNGE
jgi:hypothetical protein